MNNAAPVVLITGANRGLGLEFTKQYAEDGWHVIACCRDTKHAHSLANLAGLHSNIQLHALNISDFEAIETLSAKLSHQAIDVLINNAGVYPHSEFGDIDYGAWEQAFHINVLAPMKMVETFSPHVSKSRLKKIVTLSSKMGSIADNTSGGSYAYRSTKTAVNMVMKSLSFDLKRLGIASTILHPGWVRTDMGGPNGLIDAPESVNGLRKVIAELTLENSGRFVAYDGKEIPW